MAARFVLKKGSTGKYRFNLVATNGQIPATSAGRARVVVLTGGEASSAVGFGWRTWLAPGDHVQSEGVVIRLTTPNIAIRVQVERIGRPEPDEALHIFGSLA